MFDNIRIALLNLSSSKLRTALTMLGVTIGVAAVIILLSVGQSFEVFVRAQFEGLGVNLVFVIPDVNASPIQPLRLNDAAALQDPARVPDAAFAMPEDQFSRSVRFGTNVIQTTIEAVGAEYPALFNRGLSAGRFFDEGEIAANARVAVLEQGVVDQLFDGAFPIGQSIRIGDVQFLVIGCWIVQAGFSAFRKKRVC